MGVLDLPEPVTRLGAPPPVDTAALRAALRERVDGEVRFDAGSRAAYSTDASNFRQTPLGVVVPRTPEAGAEAVAVAREFGAPVLSRGGGTSLAGQCTNAGVVLDWSKYCTRIESVDPGARTCVVQPGIVLDDLNRQLAPHGLRYGPEPATHANCTLGGMIGNNSCGATAQAHGKVVDNIARLEVLLYDGTRFWCGKTDDEEYAEIERQGDLRATVYRRLRALRDTYGDCGRRTSRPSSSRTGSAAAPRSTSSTAAATRACTWRNYWPRPCHPAPRPVRGLRAAPTAPRRVPVRPLPAPGRGPWPSRPRRRPPWAPLRRRH